MDAQRTSSFREAPLASWVGELCFEVSVRAGKSRLTHLSHTGPLRIQRAFFPEADGTSHVVLLHPPGGVVGGDHLRIRARIGEAARCLVTVPAATKIYRSEGPTSVIENQIVVEPGASLEWLPQETIVFGGSASSLSTRVMLEGDARFLGWEMTCLGRPASGDAMVSGRLSQGLEVFREGLPIVAERLAVDAGGEARWQPWGLDGACAIGTLVLASDREGLLERARAVLAPRCENCRFGASVERVAVTQLEGALIVRYLGESIPACHELFCLVWAAMRPMEFGKVPVFPRIWRV